LRVIRIENLVRWVGGLRTHMMSETSHSGNENFVLYTQFPVVSRIVDKHQNFRDKLTGILFRTNRTWGNTAPTPPIISYGNLILMPSMVILT